MRNVGGLPISGLVQTYRHEHAAWDRGRGAWQAAYGVTIVTFRPDGQVSEGQTHNPDGSIARWAHTYDDEGRLVEVQSWSNDGPRDRVLHAYDAAGRPTVRTNVAADGSRWEGATCSYDSAGRKTLTVILPDLQALAPQGCVAVGFGLDDDDADEGVFYDSSHRLVHRVSRTRDEHGRVLREVVSLGGDTPLSGFPGGPDAVPLEERQRMAALLEQVFADRAFARVENTYDDSGRIMERTMRMGSLAEERTTFRYGETGDPIEEITRTQNRRANIDDAGLVHTSEEAPREQHTRYDYTYDERGNWIERMTAGRTDARTDFQRSVITRRAIAYHDDEVT